ncbi:hypothetical protein PP459_gp178 [Streptomyces phage Wakanda]|uniref:Uncharacterized protein n=2 Tax=Wakandavirus TaxID=3044854 RepID=A0A6G8R340_9CAUD|nr:hypothetical protein PP459_gp178 [Streptomyces phage Wakanda]YP_010652375.1 hypothetical protein PP460_gp183 [Streptomyces phage Muntaha]QIN94055.1 hypothetical protein SEA_WAKANDA_63 [Streptomyces phage Wakanda]QIN94620.1 hypothetical protein SEA_MUNTAHA_64 [Streptomyces phage Muntaha]
MKTSLSDFVENVSIFLSGMLAGLILGIIVAIIAVAAYANKEDNV